MAFQTPDKTRAQLVGTGAALQPLPDGFDEVVVLLIVSRTVVPLIHTEHVPLLQQVGELEVSLVESIAPPHRLDPTARPSVGAVK